MENTIENITRLPERQAEPEKITINLGHVDLGRIDLLVREGCRTCKRLLCPHSRRRTFGSGPALLDDWGGSA